jgi:hypothetical protein
MIIDPTRNILVDHYASCSNLTQSLPGATPLKLSIPLSLYYNFWMDDKHCPHATDISTVWYARAQQSGLWLARSADASLVVHKDFARAIACESQAQAKSLWEELCVASLTKPNPPAWASKPAQLFAGPDPDAAPAGLSVFLALCQGRFVFQKKTYTGFDWALTPNMADAHIFCSEIEAEGALRSAMPAASAPALAHDACILPLRGLFGAPISVRGHQIDPLAGAMARSGAMAELDADQLPQPQASSRKGRSL